MSALRQTMVFLFAAALGANGHDSAKLRPLQAVFPMYPEAAREKGLTAEFRVTLRIERSGRVSSVSLNEDPAENEGIFVEPLLSALRKWRYRSVTGRRHAEVRVVFALSPGGSRSDVTFDGHSNVEVHSFFTSQTSP